MRRVIERESFFALGDVSSGTFLGCKDNGCYPGDTLIDTNCIEDCERFDSYAEARHALREEDVKYWRSHYECPRAIKPVCVEVTYAVKVLVKRKRKGRKNV